MPAPKIAPPRTREELAAEVQSRTDRQVYPMTGMRPQDVRDIILRNGPTPKTAWVNPIGWHLARSAGWNDERIMRGIIVRWLADHLARPSSP